MNKKTIRAIAIVMAILAVVTLAFTGCGKKKDKETTKPQVTVSTTETTTEEATVSHVRQTRRANITATEAITETTRVRPTGTTAASIIKDGAAGAADEDPGQTW